MRNTPSPVALAAKGLPRTMGWSSLTIARQRLRQHAAATRDDAVLLKPLTGDCQALQYAQ
jgi:hypothetical protein